MLDTADLPPFRNLSPRQIVPLLADRGRYAAGESSFYRVLLAAGQLAHRQHTRPASHSRPRQHLAPSTPTLADSCSTPTTAAR